MNSETPQESIDPNEESDLGFRTLYPPKSESSVEIESTRPSQGKFSSEGQRKIPAIAAEAHNNPRLDFYQSPDPSSKVSNASAKKNETPPKQETAEKPEHALAEIFDPLIGARGPKIPQTPAPPPQTRHNQFTAEAAVEAWHDQPKDYDFSTPLKIPKQSASLFEKAKQQAARRQWDSVIQSLTHVLNENPSHCDGSTGIGVSQRRS